MKRNPYFDLPGVSNSMLNWILPETGGSPEMFTYFMNNPPKEFTSSAIQVGQALHKFIEKPSEFKIVPVQTPGDKSKDIIDILLADEEVKSLDYLFTKQIAEACDKVGFYPSWKPETRVKKIVEELAPYFNAARATDDSTALLDEDQARTVATCINVLKTKAERIFAPELYYPKDTEVMRECVIQFELEGVECKVLIDRLVINHVSKFAYVEDLKTTIIPLPHFFGYNKQVDKTHYMHVPGKFLERCIHRQLAFYGLAVKTAYKGYTIKEPWILGLETIAPFRYQEVGLGSELIELAEMDCISALQTIKQQELVSNSL